MDKEASAVQKALKPEMAVVETCDAYRGAGAMTTLAINAAFAAFDASTHNVATKEVHELKDHVLDMIGAEKLKRSLLLGTARKSLIDKLKTKTPKKPLHLMNKANANDKDGEHDEVLQSASNDEQKTDGCCNDSDEVLTDTKMGPKVSDDDSEDEWDSCDEDFVEKKSVEDNKRKREKRHGRYRHRTRKSSMRKSRRRHVVERGLRTPTESEDDFDEGTKSKNSKRLKIEEQLSDDSEIDDNYPGEMKVKKQLDANDVFKLMTKLPKSQMTTTVIDHPIRNNTVYAYDMSEAKSAWCLDDRVSPVGHLRDWVPVRSERRPKKAAPEKQLFCRRYQLRDEGKPIDFFRDVYTDRHLNSRLKKGINWKGCKQKTFVIHFLGSDNPNEVRPREQHGNLGKKRKLVGNNDIPGFTGAAKRDSDGKDDTSDYVKPQFTNSTYQLSQQLRETLSNTKAASAAYTMLVGQSAADETRQPPRDMKQLYNVGEQLKREQAQLNDDMIDVAHLARTQKDEIIRAYNVWRFLAITRHRGLQEHLVNVIGHGSGVQCHYDTTFNLGPRFVSIFSVKHPWVLTKQNQHPTLPVATLYHEGQDSVGTHGPFLRTLKDDMPNLDKPCNVLVTDREKSIRNAVKEIFPRIHHAFCHNHMRRNVKQWTSKNFNSKEARLYRKEFKSLLYAENEEELTKLLEKYCPGDDRIRAAEPKGTNDDDIDDTIELSGSELEETEQEVHVWDEKMRDYYFNYQDKDVRASYRGAIARRGIFNKNSGITNNPAENINMVFQKSVLNGDKNPTLYKCILEMYKWQNRLCFDVRRGLELTGGEYHLNQTFRTQVLKTPKIVLQSPNPLFPEDKRHVLQPAKIIKLDEYANFDVKKKEAVELLKQGLVKPIITDDGAAGLFTVQPATNTIHVVHPKAKKCTCGHTKCSHRIAVSMLIGDFDETKPTLPAGGKAMTLTGVYDRTKKRGVGKKWGQQRGPRRFDEGLVNEETDSDDEEASRDEGTNTLDIKIKTETKIDANTYIKKEPDEEQYPVPDSYTDDKPESGGQKSSPYSSLDHENLHEVTYPSLPMVNSQNTGVVLFTYGDQGQLNFGDLKTIPTELSRAEAKAMKEDYTPGWFNDNALYAYIYETSIKGSTMVIHPVKVNKIMGGMPENWKKFFWDDVGHLPPQNAVNLTLLPTHVMGNHWILMAATKDRTLKVMDPLFNYTPTEKEQENIADFLNFVYKNESGVKWKVVKPTVRKQHDGSSCGPYVCHFANCLQNNQALTTAPPTHFREAVMRTIVGNCNVDANIAAGGQTKLKSDPNCNVCKRKDPIKDARYRKGERTDWIQCDRCSVWRHNKCLPEQMTRREAKDMDRWVCP